MSSEQAYIDLLQKAVDHRQRGELNDARRCCNEVLARDTGNSEAQFVLATVEGQAGNLEQSEKLIRQAIATEPGQPMYLACLGKTLGLTGRLDEAESVYEEALSLDADQWMAVCGLGEIYGQRGHLDRARELFERAIRIDPAMAAAHRNLGTCLIQMGDREGAARAFRKAVELNPRDPSAWHSLAAVSNMAGDADTAIDCLEQALKLQPGDAKALNNLAAAYMNKSNLKKAYSYLQQAIKVAPHYAAAYNNLGKILHALCRFGEAAASLEKSAELQPDFPDAHANLGFVYQSQGRMDAAQQAFGRALKLSPGHMIALSGLAGLCEVRGEYEQGLEILADIMQRPEIDASCVVSYGLLMRGAGRQAEAIETLKHRLDQKPLSHDGKVQIRFGLGDLYDDLGDYTRAFENYRLGNDNKGAQFDLGEFQNTAATIISAFGKDTMAEYPRSTNSSSRPVFILGMPRSGKSLVEQIIASHPAVFGAGELDTIGRIALRVGAAAGVDMPYPACMTHITTEALDSLARDYLSKLGHDEPGVRYVSDTMPMNFMHIGLIELMLPGSRIIHCRRDEGDVLVSCYAKNFLDPSLGFTFDLGNLQGYMEQYQRFMTHWADVSGLSIFELSYEDIVRQPEEQIRRVIDFLDLEWSDDCLRFYEEGVATMASARMIRQPLHEKELGKYRQYEKFVQPLLS